LCNDLGEELDTNKIIPVSRDEISLNVSKDLAKGSEVALLRSKTTGQYYLVRGSTAGFEDQIKIILPEPTKNFRLIAHTHPRGYSAAWPSNLDIAQLFEHEQCSSIIVSEYGYIIRFTRSGAEGLIGEIH